MNTDLHSSGESRLARGAMRVETLSSITQLPEPAWDRLLPYPYPFLTHRFLAALEASGCTEQRSGWQPRHLILFDSGGEAVAAMPAFKKTDSYGEYIFDWAWADAYRRAGLEYYPKLLCAAPFTPVTGPRLLYASNPEISRSAALGALIDAAVEHAAERGMSSVHWLFADDADTRALEEKGLLIRVSSQFHWRNRDYRSFDDFLAALTAKKRKNIKRERRRIAEAGIRYRRLSGAALKRHHWDTMFNFYRHTIYRYGARGYLNRDLFERLAAGMSDDILLIFAYAGETPIAGGIYFFGNDALFGRYWGALDEFHSLHFETCYYQPIEYCIANGIDRFEAGAQGEHKLARGLLPCNTYSAHWLSDPRFADAVSRYTEEERRHIERYTELLDSHSPYRSAGDD